jgi:hypothetical protein
MPNYGILLGSLIRDSALQRVKTNVEKGASLFPSPRDIACLERDRVV